MVPILIFAALQLALWVLGWLSLDQRGHAVITTLDLRLVLRERVIKLLSAVLSAALVVWLVLSQLPPPAAADSFVIPGFWILGLVFHLILWLALAGQLHLLACVAVLGGYVAEATLRSPLPPRLGDRLVRLSAQLATVAANGKPVVALHAFVIFGALALAGVGLSHDREVRATEAGLAYDGFWSLDPSVEPWEHIARVQVLRDPDSNGAWLLRWEREDGRSALELTTGNLWALDTETLDAALAWHSARGIPVDDSRAP